MGLISRWIDRKPVNEQRRAEATKALGVLLGSAGGLLAIKLGILDPAAIFKIARSDPDAALAKTEGAIQTAAGVSGQYTQLQSLDADPSSPPGGSVWYRNDTGQFKYQDAHAAGVARTVNAWKDFTGAPFVTVSPVGTAQGYPKNNGADYGPDTPLNNTGPGLSVTGGQHEADLFLAARGGGTAVLNDAQALVITPSTGNYFVNPQGTVYPTPGGAAGDGTVDGILSAKEYKLTAGTGGQFVNSDALALNTVQITANPAYATGSLLVGSDGSLVSTNSPNSATPKWRTSGVGSVTTYLSLPTAGTGLSPIYGLDNRLAVAAVDGAAITLYTTVNGTSAFEVTYRIFGEAGTVTSGIYTLVWTEGGVAMTETVAITAVDTEKHDTVPMQPDNGTAITVQLTTLTGTTPKANVLAVLKEDA